jgi:hypothetical protein
LARPREINDHGGISPCDPRVLCCFTIKYSGIGSRDGLSIGVYRGKKDQNGAEKLVLVNQEKKDPIHGCVNGVAKGLLKKMTRSPHRFHVNLKTDTYPVDGAMRGQLKGL